MRQDFLLDLRGARQAWLADAENAEALVFAIEGFGRHLVGAERTLGQVSPALVEFVAGALGHERGNDLSAKLRVLVHARNDRMHKGFAARNLAKDALRVAVMIEEALLKGWTGVKVEHVMTPSPTCAATWHSFGRVRDAIIENAYSFLPILLPEGWRVVSERKVAVCIQAARAAGQDLRPCRLDAASPVPAHGGAPLWQAIVSDTLREAAPSDWIDSLDPAVGVVLVIDRAVGVEPQLVGIVTPTDIF